jgi:hypothetical protein
VIPIRPRDRCTLLQEVATDRWAASTKNPDTIIITAAATDKTSFGCSDDRDLTYFGEAFYRDALPKAQNLQDAFNQAKKAIALRETQEHQKASDPQAYFGSDLRRVLAGNPMSPPSVP